MERKKKAALCGFMTLALFAVQTVYMHANLEYAGSWLETAALSAMFALIAGAAMGMFIHLKKPSRKESLFAGVFVALTMLARVSMLDFVTGDYTSFLTKWVDVFREGGFATLGQNVGDYNLLYQYILLMIAKIPLHDLYLIKWTSVVFDYALALAMMQAARRFADERAAIPVFCVVCALPTVLLNGAGWGQCDTVYVFCVVMSLYWLKTNKPTPSAIMLSLAFAFKLQTIFFFPVVLLGLIHGEYKPRHAVVFALTYLVTLIPALIAGRPFMDALSVYVNQSMGQYYHRLTYNAPNLYTFFPMLHFSNTQEFTWMRYIDGVNGETTNPYLTEFLMPMMQNAALYACIVLTVLVVAYWLMHVKEITPELTLEVALFFAIFLPFVMPKIHERYFFMADMFSILYAAKNKDRRFMPFLVVGASMMSYFPFLTMQRPVDERVLALMMFAALILISRDILCQMRKNRVALKAEGGKAA